MVSTIPEYVVALLFSGVSLLIAALIANSIRFEGGAAPRDPGKRRLWFWIIGLLGMFSYFLFGIFDFYFPLNNTYAKSKAINAVAIGTTICFIFYVIAGFVCSATIKNGKINNWFHGREG